MNIHTKIESDKPTYEASQGKNTNRLLNSRRLVIVILIVMSLFVLIFVAQFDNVKHRREIESRIPLSQAGSIDVEQEQKSATGSTSNLPLPEDSDMSIFSALLDESDVATQLGPERFMIFAPTNDAFLRLIQDPPAYATCAEVIKNIAENHVIISKSTSTYSRDKPDRFSAINGSITHATYYPDGTIILNGSAIARPAKSPTTEYDLFKVDTVFASPPRPDETSR